MSVCGLLCKPSSATLALGTTIRIVFIPAETTLEVNSGIAGIYVDPLPNPKLLTASQSKELVTDAAGVTV